MYMPTVIVEQGQISRVSQVLSSAGLAAVSPYELAKTVFLQMARKNTEAKTLYHGVVDHLVDVGLLTRLPLKSGVHAYLLFGQGHATAQQVACSLDPFAYVSHLSAMEYHGLTDRFPAVAFMSVPPTGEWRQQARERMHKELGERFDDYIASGLPKLTRLNLTRIGQTAVQFHERSQLGAFRHVPGSPLRVATIGRVFLDMLREPALCGGIQHVIDVFQGEATRHLRTIIDEVERNGSAIDKVRAGFLLTEVCHLEHATIVSWQTCAQRGGSRKLDPENEYSPNYSERWQLSINVPSLASRSEAGHER